MLPFVLVLSHAVIIKAPSVHHHVGITISSLTDHSRDMNPFGHSSEPREVVLSAFYPVQGSCVYTVPYMPPKTAAITGEQYAELAPIPNTIFSSLELQVYAGGSTNKGASCFPLVLFTPALGTSRLLYNVIAQTIASAGYIVITTDHPYDANVVELPNGQVIMGYNATSPMDFATAVRARLGDIQFLLRALTNQHTLNRLTNSTCKATNNTSAVILGHSLGGWAAVDSLTLVALHGDQTILGAANLDGSLDEGAGPLVTGGNASVKTNPMLLWTASADPLGSHASWRTVWHAMRGWKSAMSLAAASHYTFSDLPYLAASVGLPRNGVLDDILGTLDGTRDLTILTTYLADFVGFCFRGSGWEADQARFVHNDKRFPEVNVTNFANAV